MYMEILDTLMERYPELSVCRNDIESAFTIMKTCYEKGGKVLICGNGGSAADSDHIVGELMKGFMKKRPVSDEFRNELLEGNNQMGAILADKLQGALPAINLTAQSAIFSAFSNDVDGDLVFAQQVLGYGKPNDVVIGLSTSGNSKNVCYALFLARRLGISTIGLTGASGGIMKDLCDVIVQVPKNTTPEVQELHLPVYHALCAMIEDFFFDR